MTGPRATTPGPAATAPPTTGAARPAGSRSPSRGEKVGGEWKVWLIVNFAWCLLQIGLLTKLDTLNNNNICHHGWTDLQSGVVGKLYLSKDLLSLSAVSTSHGQTFEVDIKGIFYCYFWISDLDQRSLDNTQLDLYKYLLEPWRDLFIVSLWIIHQTIYQAKKRIQFKWSSFL